VPCCRNHPHEPGAFLWLPVASKPIEIGVELGCTGSPECAAAVHIRADYTKTKSLTWAEAHLTEDEALWLISHLYESLNLHRAAVNASGGTDA
jgi:hypothetical protein